MDRLKRTAALCLVILCAAISTSCWDMREINDYLYISGVGLDTGEDGNMTVTFQSLIADRMFVQGGTDRVTANYTVEAPTLFEAVTMLKNMTDRKVTFVHTSAIIIGEELAREGFFPELDYFAWAPQFRRLCEVVTTSGTARELLESDLEKGNMSLFIEKLLKSHSAKGNNLTAKNALNILTVKRRNNEDYFLIDLEFQKGGESGEKSEGESGKKSEGESSGEGEQSYAEDKVRISGVSLFHNDQYTGRLDEKSAETLLFMVYNMSGKVVSLDTVAGQDGPFLFQSTNYETRIIPEQDAQGARFRISSNADYVLIEQPPGSHSASLSDDFFREAENKLAERLTQGAGELVTQTAMDKNTDVLGLAALARQYGTGPLDSAELLRESRFDIEANVSIPKVGLLR